MNSFNYVRDACFGEALSPDYMITVHKFKAAYLAFEIAVTPKIHEIFDHVPEFCSLKKTNLGKFSEQVSESVHADFKSTYQ